MPITATFAADFKSFYDAVQQSTVKLKDFQSNAETVARSVDKVANAFSGRKVVQDAEIMTKAIKEIGGATALTAREQAQVNAKLQEAIEKYQVLGQVAPKEMQDLEQATRKVDDETKKVAGGFEKIKGGLAGLAGAVGIAFSVDAVVGFAGKVFDNASKIQDLSEKLGISAEAVQEFKYAAEQAGGSIDDVGAAIFKMNQKLAEGDKGTVHALKDLKLSLDDLRAMSPEQAFLAITDALKTIENPAVRARLEVELLGKAGGALGAAIAAGFRDVTKAATVMENDTVKALADAQQAWENLGNTVITVTGTMMVKTADAVANITSSWEGFARFVGTAMSSGFGAAATLAANMQTAGQRKPLTAAERAEIEAQGGFGTPITAGSAEQERLAKEREAALRKQKAAVDDLRRAEEEYAKLLADDVVKAYEDTRKALQNYYDIILKANSGITGGMEGLTLRKSTEVDVVSGITGQWLAYLAAVESVNSKVVTGLESAPGQKVDTDFLAGIWGKDETKARENELKKAEAFGKNLASRIIGGLQQGNVFASVGSMLGESLGSSLGTGLSKMIGGKLGGMLGGLLGPLGELGGQLLGKLGDKLMGKLFGKEGRKSVEGFAESMGGFDALQKRLEVLGDEGAVLWKKLTQQTDRNDAGQAARHIKEVEDALDAYDKKQKDVGDTTEDTTETTEAQAKATIETASEAKKAMEELEPLLKANVDLWKVWGDDVTGHIDRVALALKSLVLPNLSGDTIKGSQSKTAGGGTAVINLDGRQIAEAVVPRIPGVVRRYGLA